MIRMVVMLALLLQSSGAAASFVLHCVYLGEVQAETLDGSATEPGLGFTVDDVMALPGSHADCQGQRGLTLRMQLNDDGLRAGIRLVVRHQRMDSLCERGTVCAQEYWQVLYRPDDAR